MRTGGSPRLRSGPVPQYSVQKMPPDNCRPHSGIPSSCPSPSRMITNIINQGLRRSFASQKRAIGGVDLADAAALGTSIAAPQAARVVVRAPGEHAWCRSDRDRCRSARVPRQTVRGPPLEGAVLFVGGTAGISDQGRGHGRKCTLGSPLMITLPYSLYETVFRLVRLCSPCLAL